MLWPAFSRVLHADHVPHVPKGARTHLDLDNPHGLKGKNRGASGIGRVLQKPIDPKAGHRKVMTVWIPRLQILKRNHSFKNTRFFLLIFLFCIIVIFLHWIFGGLAFLFPFLVSFLFPFHLFSFCSFILLSAFDLYLSFFIFFLFVVSCSKSLKLLISSYSSIGAIISLFCAPHIPLISFQTLLFSFFGSPPLYLY